MNNLPLIFCGVFLTLAASWMGIVMAPHLQFGDLQPSSTQLINPDTGDAIAGMTFVDAAGKVREGATNPAEDQFPLPVLGSAQRGKIVYQDLGCLYCHSQQVRRKGFGSDWERGWGDRQTVARDYIRQERVLLGTMRTGPDLKTAGQRIPTEDWHHQHFFYPPITSEGSLMPPFKFLYHVRPIGPDGPHPQAISIPQRGAGGVPLPKAYQVPEGHEVVPTQRAHDLVAYMLSLRLDYELPEAKFTE